MAVRAGWVVRIYQCRGWTLHSNRSASKLVTQHMMTLRRGRRRLVAWWWDGSTQGGLAWGDQYLRSVKLGEMRIDDGIS
jgi:hypothetical protein